MFLSCLIFYWLQSKSIHIEDFEWKHCELEWHLFDLIIHLYSGAEEWDLEEIPRTSKFSISFVAGKFDLEVNWYPPPLLSHLPPPFEQSLMKKMINGHRTKTWTNLHELKWKVSRKAGLVGLVEFSQLQHHQAIAIELEIILSGRDDVIWSKVLLRFSGPSNYVMLFSCLGFESKAFVDGDCESPLCL